MDFSTGVICLIAAVMTLIATVIGIWHWRETKKAERDARLCVEVDVVGADSEVEPDPGHLPEPHEVMHLRAAELYELFWQWAATQPGFEGIQPNNRHYRQIWNHPETGGAFLVSILARTTEVTCNLCFQGEPLCQHLLGHQADIEAAIGEFDWKLPNGRGQVYRIIQREQIDLLDPPATWPAILEWFGDRTAVFQEVLEPLLDEFAK